jgi:3D (Asp-Asp-Asp) domain-containing protein
MYIRGLKSYCRTNDYYAISIQTGHYIIGNQILLFKNKIKDARCVILLDSFYCQNAFVSPYTAKALTEKIDILMAA